MPETGYTRTPALLKGALIQFSAPLLVPIPNVIVFQYNPETLTRTLKPWAPPQGDDAAGTASGQASAGDQGLVQPYDPEEEFTVAIELDATDPLEHPDTHPVAVLTGIADRLAALERLLFPTSQSALSGLLSGAADVSFGAGGISFGGGAEAVPSPEVPVVLFFWGPGRILPVRVTTFSVEEQAFSPALYPLRARASVGMKVLTPEAFGDRDSADVKLAKAAYAFTRTQQQALATANVANAVESIVSGLPL